VAGLLAAAAAGPARAGDWDLQPRLRLVETYTDNVTLAPPGEEQSEYVTQVNPGVTLKGRGRRAELTLDYQMQNLFYARDSGRNTTNHQLGADGSLELVRRQVFLDAQASRSQQVISPVDALPVSNLSVTANRRDVTTYAAGPRLRHAFGSFATGNASYRWQRVEYGGRLADRTQQTANATLSSGRRFDRVGWTMAYHRTEETGEGLPDHLLETGSLDLSLLLGAKTRVFGVYGYERNDYPQAQGADPPEGDFWEAGLRFNPSLRTSFEGAYGEHYFGETKRFEFRHQGPATTWQASYRESLTTDTAIQIERVQALILDENGNVVLNQNGDPLVVEFPVPIVRTEVILQKRLAGGVAWDDGKTRLGLRAYRELREYQTSGREEEVYGGIGRMGWQAAPRTRLDLTGSWHRRLFPDSDREDELWTAEAGATRQVSRSLQMGLRYRYLRRHSNQADRGYRENQAELSLAKQF